MMRGDIKSGAQAPDGGTMKITTKIAALTIIAAFAAAPAMAAHKHKKDMPLPMDPHKMTPEQAMAYNKRNLSLFVQGLPLILPSWAVPIYFGMQKDQDKPTKHHRKKH
jgi:hypothetical protein